MKTQIGIVITLLLVTGMMAHADDIKKSMIAVIPVGGDDKSSTPMEIKHRPVSAMDWVAAWQAAKESCPNANGICMYFADRTGPTLKTMKVFDCVDIKARGDLLIITIKQSGVSDEQVLILRAQDVIRFEISRAKTGQ